MPEDRINDVAARRVMAGFPSAQPAGEAPLLTAKLTAAPVPDAAIDRPRLHRLLDDAGPVTLVSAPAGWGKSVLLSAWQRTVEGSTPGWLTLAEQDVGPRLWAYLSAALPGPGLPVQAGPGTPVPSGPPGPAAAEPPGPALPGTSVPVPGQDGFLDHLADAIARRSDPAVLILDDVDRVEGTELFDGLDFLLRHGADRLRLVLGTRSDPTVALHRWRLGGQLTEIRPAELAFTAEETAELLAAHQVVVPSAQIRRLWSRTEGWPAGLRLATLGLREHPDPARYVAEFGGDDPGVAAYLDREVLAGLSAETRDDLRTAAVTERMSGALLDALTGRHDGERTLAEAERTGFVVQVGTRPASWRCHRLLGDLLAAELRRKPSAELLELHRRAASWQAAHGLPADALRHALTAGDWSLAAAVLVDHWPALVPDGPAGSSDGDPATNPSPAAPPTDAVRAEPEVALAHAADRLRVPDLVTATAALEAATARAGRLSGDRHRRFDLVAAALRLALVRLAGGQEAIALAAGDLLRLAGPGPDRPAADLSATGGSITDGGDLPPPGQLPELSARALARTALGVIRLGAGDLVAAESELAEATAEAARAGLGGTELAAAGRLALTRAVHGRLVAAEDAARAALELPPCRDRFQPTDCAPAYLALAMVAAERDDLDDAETHLTLAAGAVEQAADPVVSALAELLRARLCRCRGDLTGGLRAVWAGRERLAGQPVPLVDHLLLAAEADLRAAYGETEVARDQLVALLDAQSEPPAAVAVALARSQLLAGDAAAASRGLPEWDGPSAPEWPLAVRLEAGLLDALAARSGGDGRRADRILERVLELAGPDGYRRIFTRSEPPVRELLAAHLESGTAHWPMLTELIDGTATVAVAEPAPPGLPEEPLTERELTVLRYLQSILSNVEIASEMSLSVNTVKTHVRNIYRKLDATRRREAVKRARQLHLI